MLEKIFAPETYSMLGGMAITFCKNLVVAILVYYIGSKLIKWISKLITKALERSKVDKSLFSFLTSIVNVVLSSSSFPSSVSKPLRSSPSSLQLVWQSAWH